MWVTSGKLLSISCGLLFNLSLAQQSPFKIQVKNISYLGPQISPQLSGLSRDGGASVLLNDHVIWLFDDTQIISKDGELITFMSNTAAYSHAPKTNLTLLQNFGIATLGKQRPNQSGDSVTLDESFSNGGWIPFTEDELAINRQNPGRERVAICKFLASLSSFWDSRTLHDLYIGPGTNPTPMNLVTAILYAPLVYVETTSKTDTKQYKAHGVTLITIRDGNAGPSASRAVDVLFSSEDVQYGVFAAVVGRGTSKVDLYVYLFGIASSGLQLARVQTTAIKNRNAYEYFDPASCSFKSAPPSPAEANLSSVYLSGGFSSGSIFYTPFLKTYLLVYLNDQADSTFYVRYLNLGTIICPTTTWVKDGKYGNGIQAEDVEAVFRYGWSPEAVLYQSPPGPKGFNYAGLAHPEFFNNQYYARWTYSYQGVDSDMESGWVGGGLVGQQQAGGDGRHILLSWTSQEEGLDGHGRYQVMLAKVELDAATIQSSATPPGAPSHTSSTTTASPSGDVKVNTGSSISRGRIWSKLWQFGWPATGLLAFCLPCL